MSYIKKPNQTNEQKNPTTKHTKKTKPKKPNTHTPFHGVGERDFFGSPNHYFIILGDLQFYQHSWEDTTKAGRNETVAKQKMEKKEEKKSVALSLRALYSTIPYRLHIMALYNSAGEKKFKLHAAKGGKAWTVHSPDNNSI